MNKIYYYFIKFLLCSSLFISLGIVCKLDNNYKIYLEQKIYQEYLDFSSVRLFYDKYMGGIFPIENSFNKGVVSVFNEELNYKVLASYKEGVSLEVAYNYLVPSINSGLVVYVGEKEGYGNVVIIEGDDDIDIWYGNLCNNVVSLYDFISSGSYIGEVCNNKLYLVYTKKNEFLDYRNYLE